GTRTPLWQQRQRAADLLAVASKHGSFPILLETYRECLRDAFDVPALIELMSKVRARQLRVVSVDTARPSPFATSLAFGYIASFIYEGDAPIAERRAQALTLDRELLAELLGADEVRELVQPAALAALEASSGGLATPTPPTTCCAAWATSHARSWRLVPPTTSPTPCCVSDAPCSCAWPARSG
ncbi:MAG: hypothetical protein E6G57_08070, partial [Actinobacteria bacterium]